MDIHFGRLPRLDAISLPLSMEVLEVMSADIS